MQKEITSADNAKIKHLKKLGMKKYRDKDNEFVVENAVLIDDAVAAGYYPKQIFVTEAWIEKNERTWNNILDRSGIETFYAINEKINRVFSELETPSGIVALYDKLDKPIDYKTPIAYLNGISDPGNLGTILRSALAFGFSDIVLDENCADLYNPKTIQAAKESIFKLNIERDEDQKIFKKIRKIMPVFATQVDEGEDVKSFLTKDNFCIVLGSESHGVDPAILKQADGYVRIKMSDQIESLNVAAAAAIIFHEIYQNRH